MTPIKIFVAEDNAADRFWLELVLKNTRLDYTLAVASDGESAKEYLQKHTVSGADAPDLIFLDMNMPGLTAFDILQQVPAVTKLPFCILTGSATDEARFRKQFSDSAARYMLKPLTQAKLLACLRCFEPLRPIAEEMTHQ